MDNIFLSENATGQLNLTEEGASHFARLALDCLRKEYPNKLNQVLHDESYMKGPKELHPAFYGCFDWHSSVHGTWMLIRLLKTFPTLPEGKEIREVLRENLNPENMAIEVEYFSSPGSKSWERMYGWAWLLKLCSEAEDWNDPDGKYLAAVLDPLAKTIEERYTDFLPRQEYAIRTGVHPNTAFGLAFAYDYALQKNNEPLLELLRERSKYYFLNDRKCPATWEPGGEDFLSPCLIEADLMTRILSPDEFQKWFKKFLPPSNLENYETPASVSDRTDGKIVHLDGLNLSRAWCLLQVSKSVRSGKVKDKLLEMAKKHIEVTLPNIASGNYEGEHWLASFAVYALSLR